RQMEFLEDSCGSQDRALGAQEQICDLSVCVIGVGGVGNFVVQNLAMAGVRHFVLVDPDRVELSNLSRQILFRESDVGRSKVNAAADWIRGFDSEAVVDTRSRSVRNA